MSHRRDRAAEEIRRELSNLLFAGLPKGNTPSVFLDRVEIAPDLSTARVFVSPSIPGRPYVEKDLVAPLQEAELWLRQQLFKRMRIRRVPRMKFCIDKGKEHAKRIERLLDEVKKRGGMGVLLLAMLLQPWVAGAAQTLERYETSAMIMGSEFRVALYGTERKRLAVVADAALEEARKADRLLSDYLEDSELSRVNREAGSGPVAVSAEFFDVLERCLEYSHLSEGAFDPTVGRLMKTWGFYKGKGALPNRFSIWWTLRSVGYSHLSLDAQERTVSFERSGLELDPGGFGKGYAVERMIELLRAQGIDSAMVSGGASTLYGIGAPPDEPQGWRTEIRDPKDRDRVVETLYLRDESLSTSGSYEKFFTVDGVVYSHIMDPRTGMPAKGALAVSVVAPSAFDTEVWSTALFVNGKSWAEGNVPEGLRVLFCADGTDCGWLE
jgi:thiamine biosynthesis lipoprotein